ncbi:MAG: M81 family metallopeptidase [Lachnospiraceae bacterium]|nr:M81 family metallopeptidase [Lachnospiraceae bacterium]
MDILYFEYSQETNSFNPFLCDETCFRKGVFREGEDIFTGLGPDVPMETNGMRKAAEEAGAHLIPCLSLWSQSMGPVRAEIVDFLLSRIRQCYAEHPDIGGVFAVLHGGTQDTREDDSCGYLLEKIREMVGPEVVIAASYDMHANITEKILKNTDVCCGYQTYPHRDTYETGYRAARLGIAKIQNRNAFVTAAVTVPMIVPASGYTSDAGCFHGVLEMGHHWVREGKLLDFSVFQMQPWLDVSPAGSTVVTVAEDASSAARCAEELAQKLFDGREEYWPKLETIDEVLDIASSKDSEKPVILANAGDSPNGGAIGDSVAVLKRILERRLPIRFATVVRDSAAVEKAFAAGVGREADFSIGAGSGIMGQTPAQVRGTVCSLHDGNYRMEGPIGRGLDQSVGPAATIRVGSCDIMLCGYPANTGDPQIYRHFGIEPSLYDLVEVKANTSFRLPFSSFTRNFHTVDVPGCVGISDLKSLPFRKITGPFYPFDTLTGYTVERARIYKHG